MGVDRGAGDPPIHEASKLQIADGALARMRILHERTAQLSAAVERSRPLPTRIARGVRRARRNGWRLHRYPRDYWRGLRATGATKFAKADITTLQSLTERGNHDQAVAFAAALLPVKADDVDFLEAARHAFAKAGALSLQAQATAALRRLADTPARRRQERKVLGRIRETEPDWWPHVPPGLSSQTPVAGRVLHMVKAAMPYRQSGYTIRSRHVIASQRSAGLDPVVMTALGFPQQVGITDPPLTEVVDGVVHHHLVPESDHVLDTSVDRYLNAYAAAAAARAAEISPSLIHVHSGYRGYESALVGVAVARALQVPLVYEVRGFFESLWSRDLTWNERGESYARRLAAETRCLRAADAIVTLSESMRSEIVSRGVTAAKVFVVPNGVDVDAFCPGPRSAELVEELRLDGAFVLGYVSSLDHYREGHETLVRAAVALRARGIPAVALIVGDGSRRAELEELAAREQAGDAVVFTGDVPYSRVLDYYRLLDVFVVPRVAERAARLVTPLKPVEAMAAGVPVVVSQLDALLEIVGDDRGRSFPPGDADSLAAVLSELYDNASQRSTLAALARDWVVKERQWSASAATYVSIYDQLRTHPPR